MRLLDIAPLKHLTVRLRKTTPKTCCLCRRFVCQDHSVNATVCFECPL